jgi:hypothetical protein
MKTAVPHTLSAGQGGFGTMQKLSLLTIGFAVGIAAGFGGCFKAFVWPPCGSVIRPKPGFADAR